jgi:2-oxoglutarate dehydrogenase E2 component (dihydrolipoamide succinyltransferase)
MDPDREPLDVSSTTEPGTHCAPEPAAPAARDPPSADPPEARPPSPQPAATPASDPASPAGGASTAPDVRDAAEPEPDPADTLSPAVRRLVRQYDLDITGIHGTGPAGKIRVVDVIGMLGGRAEPGARAGEASRGGADDADAVRAASATPRGESDAALYAETGATPRETDSAAAGAAPGAPTTTVFECDLSRVLSHRKRARRDAAEILLTSYFLAACAEALRAVPEIAADGRARAGAPRLGVLLGAADGAVRRTLVAADEPALDERLRALDRQLRASGDDDLDAAQLLVHHYGPSGSLLATPTELGAGHAASVGIGRVRRQIVVKAVDAEEAPRVTALCYVTLTFVPDRVTLNRANRFVAEVVRVLEQWPAEAAG